MAKRKITKLEITTAVIEHAGNVTAIARALECTPQTVYNTLDAYGIRGDLEAARSSAKASAAKVLHAAPDRLRRAIIMLAESTGGITKDELVQLFAESAK